MNALVMESSNGALLKIDAPQTSAVSLMSIIERAATAENFDVAKIQQLLELKERWDATEARKAFTVDMAAFKANPPTIYKNKTVNFETSKGTTTYDHATHSEVVSKIAAGLGAHNMSHRWEVKQSQDSIQVTCVITHALGHTESVALHAAADTSGSKNAIQAIGSAVTYLQRYTLLAATGLTTTDHQDDDGQAAGSITGGAQSPNNITLDQMTVINDLIKERGIKADAVLKFLRIDSLDQLPRSKYAAAVTAIKNKPKAS